MKKKELVGKEVYGFKFPSGTDGIFWNPNGDMEKLIGQIGTIKRYGLDDKSVLVEFPKSIQNINSHIWGYPVSMVSEHLLENQETEIFKII